MRTLFGDGVPVPHVPGNGLTEARADLHRRFARRVQVNPDFTRKLVSYQGNKGTVGFRWMKYKEGFSTALARRLIESGKGAEVLDPFSGAGTTALTAMSLGVQGTGIEILPLTTTWNGVCIRASATGTRTPCDGKSRPRTWRRPGSRPPRRSWMRPGSGRTTWRNRSSVAGTSSIDPGRGWGSSRSRFARPSPALWRYWAPRAWPRRKTAGAARSGVSLGWTAVRPRTRAGPPPWIPSAPRASSANVWPTGAGTRRFVRWSSKALAADAVRRLAERGQDEGQALRGTLQRQRQRVVEELARHEAGYEQLTLKFDPEETRQLEADMRHWRRRLARFDRDLEREPARLREFYEVRAQRMEPVGLVYLWPETG